MNQISRTQPILNQPPSFNVHIPVNKVLRIWNQHYKTNSTSDLLHMNACAFHSASAKCSEGPSRSDTIFSVTRARKNLN